MIKFISLLLLLCLTLSFPFHHSQGKQGNPSTTSEVLFLGKEETRWIEKREIPLPLIIGQRAERGT